MVIRLAVAFWLLVWIVNIQAVSIGRTKALSYLTSVRDLSISGDGVDQKVTVSVEIPSTRRYHNIARRWWAAADPNNAGLLAKFGFNKKNLITQVFNEAHSSFGVSSETLFSYLTKNSSTLETPQNAQQYKFVLEPNPHASVGHTVWTVDERGVQIPHPDFPGSPNVVSSFRGTAYRKMTVYRVSDGRIQYKYKPVGWARISIHDIQGANPRVRGSWKVDDEEGLGVPPAIYHIDDVDSFRLDLRDDELPLLQNITSNLVVWRDLDMRTSQYRDYEILDDDYNPLLDDPRITKREPTPEFDSKYILPEHYARIPTSDTDKSKESKGSWLFRRSGQDNDTGDSGFSSGINLRNSIGNSDGCPTKNRVALVGLAADCNYMKDFNSTSDIREHFINIVNEASEQYERSFNITLGLASIFIPRDGNCSGDDLEWNYDCDENPSDMISDRLDKFSRWRGEGNRTGDGYATWSLFTSCRQDSVVGLSWMGMVCNSRGRSASGANVIVRTPLDWRVFAHEVGHSFGAVHDCTDSTCSQGMDRSSQCCPRSSDQCDASGEYLMNPSSTDSQDGFSPCTQGNVCGAMRQNSVNASCLTSNSGVNLVTKNECGNGIVEDGEECDCGGEEGCGENSCCDPETCQFRDGAECDDANEMCCNNCTFASSDTICRESKGPCDPAEYCTGNSSTCPDDEHRDNGEECSDDDHPDYDLICISGHCTSRDLQCVQLLENTTLRVGGDEVNVSRACDDDRSCQLSCVDPSSGPTCITTSQNFLDGTPCRGGNGQCERGRCVGGSSFGDSNGPFSPSWFERNKATVIGVVCGILGLILLLILLGCIRRRIRTRKMIKAAKENTNSSPTQTANTQPFPPPPPPPQLQSNNPWYSPPPPPPMTHNR